MSDEQGELELTPVNEIKALVDLLDSLGIDPLHLHIDGSRPTDSRPNVRLWLRYRTEFETVCKRLKLKPAERRYMQHGVREWNAEGDTPMRRLLVSCASLAHHPDWVPRAEVPVAPPVERATS